MGKKEAKVFVWLEKVLAASLFFFKASGLLCKYPTNGELSFHHTQG